MRAVPIDKTVQAVFDKAMVLIDAQNEATGATRTTDTREYEVRTIGAAGQAKTALDTDLNRCKAVMAKIASGEADATALDELATLSASLRTRLNTTQYIGQGETVRGALEFLDMLDESIDSAKAGMDAVNVGAANVSGPALSSSVHDAGAGAAVPTPAGPVADPDVTLGRQTGHDALAHAITRGENARMAAGQGLDIPAAGGALNGPESANADGSGAAAVSELFRPALKAQKTASTGEAGRIYHGEVLDKVRAHLDEVKELPVVARLTGGEFQKQSGDTRTLRAKVMDFFNSLGNKVTRTDIGDIALNNAGARDSTGHGYGKVKAATYAALPSVLRDGKIIEVVGPYEGHGHDSIFIAAPVEISGSQCYVGALVIRDANTQRYKLHEVLTTNENGTPLFKSETVETDKLLRSGVPSEEPADTTHNADVATSPVPNVQDAPPQGSSTVSIPQTPAAVKAEETGGAVGVGAAEVGFQIPGGPSREARTSRYASSMGYNADQGEATGLDRESYEARFRYRVESEAESSQRAYEMLFYRQGAEGEEVFIKDLDPAGYQEITAYLENAPAWGPVEMDTAQYILSELRRRAVMGEGTQEEYARWQEIVMAMGRKTGQGVQANAKWSRSDNAGGRATENEAWKVLQDMDLTDEERQSRFAAIVKFDMDIEAAKTPEELKSVILDIARERGTVNRALTGKESKRLVKLAQAALDGLDEGELRQFAYASAAALVKDLTPANLGEKLKTIQVLNMLSAPKTAARNLVGNTTFYALDAITMRAGAIVDMALSHLTGTRSMAMEGSVLSKESRAAIVKAIRRSIAEVTLDVDMGGENRYRGHGGRTFRAGGNVAERVGSVLERNLNYLMTTTDEAFKGAARATEGATQQLVEQGKIKTRNKNYAAEQADALAKYRTFQNDTAVTGTLQAIHDVLNAIPLFPGYGKVVGKKRSNIEIGDIGTLSFNTNTFGAGDLAAPFTRVAANLWTVGLNYSPANAVKGAAEIVGVVVDAAKTGKATVTDADGARRKVKVVADDIPSRQAKGVSDLTRGLTGTALAVGFAILASAGLIRRADDEDDEDVAAMNRAEGMTGTQSNADAIGRALSGGDPTWMEGDTLVDLSSVQPLNYIIDLGVELAKLQDDEESGILSVFHATGNSALHSAQDLPVLQGVSDIGEDVFKYDKNPFLAVAERLGKTAVSSFSPNWLAALAKGLDDKQRSAYSSDKEGLARVGDVLVDTAKGRYPGLRQTLPTSTGPDGEVKENPGNLAQRMMNALLNPLGVNTYTQSEESREMAAVREETGKTDFYPSNQIPKSVRYTDKDGEVHETTLDHAQRQSFQQTRGAAQLVAVSDMMGTAGYRSADADTRAALLKLCYDYAYGRAKTGVLGDEATDAWVRHARDSQKDLGISTAEYLYYYEALGSDIMSGPGYERTCRMVRAGVGLEDWARMKGKLDADDSGGVSSEELETYISAHFPSGQRWAIFHAYNENWKNPY